MNIPSWIEKRVSVNEHIESYVEGKLEAFEDEQYESKSFAAIVGTTSGIYFFSKSFISKGFSHFNTWESFIKKAYIYSETGLFKSKIIIKIKKSVITISTSKSEANDFLSYYSNKKTQSLDNSNITHYTTSSDIIKSIHELKSLLADGIITVEEYELKKARLLNRL